MFCLEIGFQLVAALHFCRGLRALLSSVAAVPADVDVPRGREEASGGLGAKHHGPTERLELCQRP